MPDYYTGDYCIETLPSGGGFSLTIKRHKNNDPILQALFDFVCYAQPSYAGDVIDTDTTHLSLHGTNCPPPKSRHYHTIFLDKADAENVITQMHAITPNQLKVLRSNFHNLVIPKIPAYLAGHEVEFANLVPESLKTKNKDAAREFFNTAQAQIKRVASSGAPLIADAKQYKKNKKGKTETPLNVCHYSLFPYDNTCGLEPPLVEHTSSQQTSAAAGLLGAVLIAGGLVIVIALIVYCLSYLRSANKKEVEQRGQARP